MTDRKLKRVIMLGAGGHARVLQESLAAQGVELAGYIAPTGDDSRLIDVAWLGDDERLAEFSHDAVELVNGVGSVGSPRLRRDVFLKARQAGFTFRAVIDPSAQVKRDVQLGEGVQILTGAIICTGVALDDDVIVNSGAIVDHDTTVGAHTHISPGVVVAGGVCIGETCHIGLGARLIQGVTVGSESTVGAGAVVLRDVGDGMVAVGVPAAARPAQARPGEDGSLE